MMPRDAVSHAAMHLIDVVFLARTSLKKKEKKTSLEIVRMFRRARKNVRLY